MSTQAIDRSLLVVTAPLIPEVTLNLLENQKEPLSTNEDLPQAFQKLALTLGRKRTALVVQANLMLTSFLQNIAKSETMAVSVIPSPQVRWNITQAD